MKRKESKFLSTKGNITGRRNFPLFLVQAMYEATCVEMKKTKLSKLPGVRSFTDFGLETGSVRRLGLDMKTRKKALDSSAYNNTSPIIGLKERNSLPYFMVYLETVFYLPIVSWYLLKSCKFVFPLSKTWPPPPPSTSLLCSSQGIYGTVCDLQGIYLYLNNSFRQDSC